MLNGISSGRGWGEVVLESFKNLKSCQSILGASWAVAWGWLRPSHWTSIPPSVPQLSLEDPIKTAVLLSLVGVRSILANQWPTFLQDNALRASILWESERARVSQVRPQPCGPLLKPASSAPASLREVSFLGMLTVGRPIGRAVRLLQRMGAGDPRNHGNGCCPPSPVPAAAPAVQGHLPASVPAVLQGWGARHFQATSGAQHVLPESTASPVSAGSTGPQGQTHRALERLKAPTFWKARRALWGGSMKPSKRTVQKELKT